MDTLELDNLGVSGISTFAGALDVNSTTNFGDDVTFAGASNNIVFDKSNNQIKFDDAAQLKIGSAGDLKLHLS